MKLTIVSTVSLVFGSVLSTFTCHGAPVNLSVKRQNSNIKRPAFMVEKYVEEPTKKNHLQKLPSLKGGALSILKHPKILMKLGDVANILTAFFSTLLLMRTPFDIKPSTSHPCKPAYTSGGFYPEASVKHPLDKCYVMDGFCITDPTSYYENSHMLSFYADILMTIPLLLLRSKNLELLNSLNLNDYLLSKLKMTSVAGHGIAHLSLSILSLGLSPSTEAFFQKIGNSFLAKAAPSLFVIWALNSNIEKYAETVAPIVGGLVLGLNEMNKLLKDVGSQASIVEFLTFGVPCYIFFSAGIPSYDPRRGKIALAATVITTFLSINVLQVKTPANSFVVVFTAAYLVSAIYQVFFWEKTEKEKCAIPYAITAWSSNLLTTLVGWAIARGCTDLLRLGGHVLYDLSIPLSYFIIFYATKFFSS